MSSLNLSEQWDVIVFLFALAMYNVDWPPTRPIMDSEDRDRDTVQYART